MSCLVDDDCQDKPTIRFAGMEDVVDAIKARIEQAGDTYLANDNISKHLQPGELEIIQALVEADIQSMLEHLVIDTKNDHNTQETAKRVAKMFIKELYRGRYEPQPTVTVFPNVKKLDELYIVGPISVKSACSHHLVPILGKVWVGIIPSDTLSGLSKFARLAEWVFRRPQIQEEATVQYAELIQELVEPKALAVVVKAQHMCMSIRGVEDPESEHTTSYMGGDFRTIPSLKSEFMSLIALK